MVVAVLVSSPEQGCRMFQMVRCLCERTDVMARRSADGWRHRGHAVSKILLARTMPGARHDRRSLRLAFAPMDTPVASESADGRSRARTGYRKLFGSGVRSGLLVAITIGVFYGAMACATSMAAGDGHGAHAAVGEPRTGHPDAGQHGHASGAAADDADPSRSSDGAPESSSTEHGHPGMACVTSVQLRVPALVVPADVSQTSSRSTMTPPDCVTEPEPPVPRFS
jgi:hypothetical protein